MTENGTKTKTKKRTEERQTGRGLFYKTKGKARGQSKEEKKRAFRWELREAREIPREPDEEDICIKVYVGNKIVTVCVGVNLVLLIECWPFALRCSCCQSITNQLSVLCSICFAFLVPIVRLSLVSPESDFNLN